MLPPVARAMMASAQPGGGDRPTPVVRLVPVEGPAEAEGVGGS